MGKTEPINHYVQDLQETSFSSSFPLSPLFYLFLLLLLLLFFLHHPQQLRLFSFSFTSLFIFSDSFSLSTLTSLELAHRTGLPQAPRGPPCWDKHLELPPPRPTQLLIFLPCLFFVLVCAVLYSYVFLVGVMLSVCVPVGACVQVEAADSC